MMLAGLRPAVRYSSRSYIRCLSSQASGPSTKYLKPLYSSFTHSQEDQEALGRYSKYILPVYVRAPFVLSHGKGLWVWDTAGRKYLDFTAGIAVNALGHADEGVCKVLADQANKLTHISNLHHNEYAGRLAELLVELTKTHDAPSFDGAKVFFTNSGTEAVEGALKAGRKVGKERWAKATGKPANDPSCDKYEIVCFEGGFHGRSMGALSVTTNPPYQDPFRPLIPGVRVGQFNTQEAIDDLVTEKTCAVIVEPIQGEGGLQSATVDWLKALRKKCDEVGAVLIFDEIQCGLYRTGSIWAHSTYGQDCRPDIITSAKPLANGYPIGAILMRDEIAQVMSVGSHGTTFGGSPLACTLGHHVLQRLSDDAFTESIKENSDYMAERLVQMTKWFPKTIEPEIRGKGFIRGIGFYDQSLPRQVLSLARERGVLVLIAGDDAVRLVPSLIAGKKEIDVAMDVLEGCLSIVENSK